MPPGEVARHVDVKPTPLPLRITVSERSIVPGRSPWYATSRIASRRHRADFTTTGATGRKMRVRNPTAPAALSCTAFATELANADVSAYTLMKLLGHESMVTSQRYVTAAGAETRTAAAQNTLYDLLAEER